METCHEHFNYFPTCRKVVYMTQESSCNFPNENLGTYCELFKDQETNHLNVFAHETRSEHWEGSGPLAQMDLG